MGKYKVCILTAGVGNRMGEVSKYINKALLPVNFKAVISYIVEKFPNDVEFVIALGHKKDTVVDYLELAHPDRKFTFVEVDKYLGPGTGPGHSVLQCQDELDCPFILITTDTIVLENIPEPTENWFGLAPVEETERYCTVKIKNNLIYQLDDKIKTDNKYAFIGLTGVKDHAKFFSALERDKKLISGEIQLSNGFKQLLDEGLHAKYFTWSDTGTLETYKETNQNFSGAENSFDFSKGNEFIYFVGDRVIKFYANAEIIKQRIERAKILKGLCPPIEDSKPNFYSYKKVEGETLYSAFDLPTFKEFLAWSRKNLWTEQKLSSEEQKKFRSACEKFYEEKTKKRLDMFYAKTGITDTEDNINGTQVPKLTKLFKKMDWNYLYDGIPSKFHGDLQFDNVLVNQSQKSGSKKFLLLDWRQDFGGLQEYGDLYYDLAKMYGGMILSYQLIKKNMFSFDSSGSNVYYDVYNKLSLTEGKEFFEKFLVENDFDLRKVKIHTALIFLNMSPLHHEPFDSLLYYLGKNMLHKVLNEDEPSI